MDLTGGVAEILDIGGSEMTPQLKDELHARLSDASRKGSPLCAMHELYEEADGLTLTEGRLPCGNQFTDAIIPHICLNTMKFIE